MKFSEIVEKDNTQHTGTLTHIHTYIYTHIMDRKYSFICKKKCLYKDIL